jgi:hypothetical protein
MITITYDEDTLPLLNMFLWVWTIKNKLLPLENKSSIYENGCYKIENELLFQPPEFSRKIIIFTTLTSLC